MANFMPSSSVTGNFTLTTGETAIIPAGVVVASGTGAALLASGGGAFIYNYGTINSLNGVAASGTLVNYASGVILSASFGVWTNGSTTVDNRGGYIFANGVGFYDQGANSTFRNSGTIVSGLGDGSGHNAGVWIFGNSTLINSGTIRAELAGSFGVKSFPGFVSVQTITNTGTIVGKIELYEGADVLKSASGKILGVIDMGNGNDTVIGTALADNVFGGGDADTLNGNAGNDTLRGDAGADKINGGLGKDTLTGGADADRFIFSSKTHSVVGINADSIMDFDDGNTGDRIDLSALFGPTMTYLHSGAFTAAGQVRINDISGADVVVEVNTGGTLAADFSIRLVATTLASMNAGDFVL